MAIAEVGPQREGLEKGALPRPFSSISFTKWLSDSQKRKEESLGKHQEKKVGIEWHWLEGNKIPSQNQFGKYNSEAKLETFSMFRFADDTTILGRADEIEQRITCIKRNMEAFEEKINLAKEEVVNFGDDNSANVRMLGCWLDPKVDIQNSIKIAEKLWARVRPQLVNSKMTKRQHALVVQTCVESGLPFDVATRSCRREE